MAARQRDFASLIVRTPPPQQDTGAQDGDDSSTLPSLTIATSTTSQRSAQAVLPPPHDGVDHLVIVQTMGEPPGPKQSEWADRADLAVVIDPGSGLSRSRNLALMRTTAELLAFNDDDVALDMDGIDGLRAAFAAEPQLGLALGRRSERLTRMPTRRRLTRWNTGHACAPEIMVRVDAVRQAGIRFDERFGIGAVHPIGEDYIFVADILTSGIQGVGLPVGVGHHRGDSTGSNWSDPRLTAARRAVLRRAFGPLSGLAATAYGLKYYRALGGLRPMIRFILSPTAGGVNRRGKRSPHRGDRPPKGTP